MVVLAGCGYFGKWFSEPEGLQTEAIWIAPDAFRGIDLSPQALGFNGSGAPSVPGQLIVKLKEGRFSSAAVSSLCQKHSLQQKGQITPLRMILVKIPEGVSLEEAKARLEREADVEYVEPNGVYYLFGQPVGAASLVPKHITNDPFMPLWQWGLFAIDFHKIPASALPTSAPAIAVVDTGVDYNHPDLKGKVIKGPDYFDGDMDPMDTTGHGTHVAGIAAALTDNNTGVAGVSGRSQVLAIRVGYWWIPVFAGAAGIVYAADNTSVKVINLSWGGDTPFATIADAVQYATNVKGKIVVAAAGNKDSTDPVYPAAFPNVIAVGATDWVSWEGCPLLVSVKKACDSNYGDYVDIAAPGHGIYSTVPGGGYEDWNGTSMAAPFVSGAAALIWGKWPSLTRQQVEYLLLSSAREGIDPDDCADRHEFPSYVKHLNVYNAFAARMTMGPAGGALLGLVVDANTGLPLGGATVTAKSGTITRTATTRSDGTFTITNLPAGTYELSAAKAGYVTTGDESTWTVEEGCFCLLPFIALPKVQASDVYTVVLEWRGWYPPDEEGKVYGVELDSFLWLPVSLPERNRYIVYWFDKGHFTVHPYARLLRDEPSEMPGRPWEPLYVEALTFRARYPGMYTFAVNDYAGYAFWDDYDAVVRLYRGSTLVGTYLVRNATGSGDWWKVFTVSGTTVTAVNQLTMDFPGPYGWDTLSGAPQKQVLPGAALPRGEYKYQPR